MPPQNAVFGDMVLGDAYLDGLDDDGDGREILPRSCAFATFSSCLRRVCRVSQLQRGQNVKILQLKSDVTT
jgi:hypothetical protein